MNVVEIIKASVGPLVVVLVAWLANAIIKGDVTERNSFGLMGVIAIISALGSAYALWAYGFQSHVPPAAPPAQKGDSSASK